MSSHKKQILHNIAFLALLLSLDISAGAAPARGSSPGHAVVTTGIAGITDNNLVNAQSGAIADAHRKAIFQAAGSLLTFEQIERQLPSLKTLLAQAADYIESYKILYDSRRGDSYHITLESTVDMQKLKTRLQGDELVASADNLPAVLLMVARQRPGRDVYTCWWSFIDPETSLTPVDLVLRDELQRQGFEVIDHSRMVTRIAGSSIYGCLDMDPENLRALGRQFQADMVITARVQASEHQNGDGSRSYQAGITGMAVKITDGSSLATIETYMPSSNEGDDPAYESALKNTAREFAHRMGEQIALRWLKENKGVIITSLSISGISSYLDFTRFKNALKKNLPVISAITHKSAALQGALLELESGADTMTLAQELEGRSFDDFSISITRIAPPLIEAEVRVSEEIVEPAAPEENL